MSETMLRPMPLKFGVGFVAEKQYPEDLVADYRYEKAGNYHNYHVTPERWTWPAKLQPPVIKYVIDGFSPNLNKELHVGHIRQLALANSLKSILVCYAPKFVALLGATLGIISCATEGWKYWTQLTGYHPEVYYDVLLPRDIVDVREPTAEEYEKGVINPNDPDDKAGGDFDLPRLWDGPNGPIMVIRSDGRPLYAFCDLVFAKLVKPTHYITGHEQRSHFEALGLGDKHLSMGLVLGPDGSKLKSRTGDAMLAKEAIDDIVELLSAHAGAKLPRHDMDKLAWNILCWNFLHSSRATNLKFEAEKWVRPEAPGLYITYTYARTVSVLKCADRPDGRPNRYNWDGEVTDEDVKLLGLAEQYEYYHYKAVTALDPSPLANFAHELARALSAAYERERVRGGREAFYHTISHVLWRLGNCLEDLGMFRITEV